MVVLAHDHARVDGHVGAEKERAPVLDLEERVRHGFAFTVGDDRAAGSLGDRAHPGRPALELARKDTFTSGNGEELAAEAHQASRWHEELQAYAAASRGLHVHQPTLARAETLG